MISWKSFVFLVVIIVIGIVTYDVSMKRTARAPSSDLKIQLDQSTWTKYKAPDEAFEVFFPTMPQHVSEVGLLAGTAKNVKYDIFLAQGKDGTTFMLSTIAYSSFLEESQKDSMLDNVMKEMVASNSQNSLLHSEKKVVQNFPALDFSIKSSDFVSRSMAILAKNCLYVLTVMERDEDHLDEDFQRFVSSLKIKKIQ